MLALAPSTGDGPCTPSAASYERQYAFLHRYAYLVGDYRWPLPVIGGLVRVELQGSGTLRATLTTRSRVAVGRLGLGLGSGLGLGVGLGLG